MSVPVLQRWLQNRHLHHLRSYFPITSLSLAVSLITASKTKVSKESSRLTNWRLSMIGCQYCYANDQPSTPKTRQELLSGRATMRSRLKIVAGQRSLRQSQLYINTESFYYWEQCRYWRLQAGRAEHYSSDDQTPERR